MPLAHDGLKSCTRCGREQPVAEFCKDAQKADGLHPRCRTCQRQYYRDNREAIRAYQAAYHAANAVELCRRAKLRRYRKRASREA